MEYKIVEGFTFQDLENKVSQLLKEGWQPLGGVSVSDTKFNSVMFYQALVKYEFKGTIKRPENMKGD